MLGSSNIQVDKGNYASRQKKEPKLRGFYDRTAVMRDFLSAQLLHVPMAECTEPVCSNAGSVLASASQCPDLGGFVQRTGGLNYNIEDAESESIQ